MDLCCSILFLSDSLVCCSVRCIFPFDLLLCIDMKSCCLKNFDFVEERKRRMDKKEILRLQENERRRIAEGLHDTTVQDMVCLSQQLEMILFIWTRM